MKDIENRYDIQILVNQFYTKVRKDPLLSPIFNHHIPNKNWPSHLSKLTDFWETILFHVPSFRGSPTKKHIDVDKQAKHQIDTAHFEKWISLWRETIDELYLGKVASMAKEASQKMGSAQLAVIRNHR